MDGTTEGNGTMDGGEGAVETPTPEIVPPDVARLVEEPVARVEEPGEPPVVAPPPPPPVPVTQGDGVPWAWWIGLAVAALGIGVMVYVVIKRRRSHETDD